MHMQANWNSLKVGSELQEGILGKNNQSKCKSLVLVAEMATVCVFCFNRRQKRNPTLAKIWCFIFVYEEEENCSHGFFWGFCVVFFSCSWCTATTGQWVNRVFRWFESFNPVQCESEPHQLKTLQMLKWTEPTELSSVKTALHQKHVEKEFMANVTILLCVCVCGCKLTLHNPKHISNLRVGGSLCGNWLVDIRKS